MKQKKLTFIFLEAILLFILLLRDAVTFVFYIFNEKVLNLFKVITHAKDFRV